MNQEKSEEELNKELKDHKTTRRNLKSALKAEEEKIAELNKEHSRPSAGRP